MLIVACVQITIRVILKIREKKQQQQQNDCSDVDCVSGGDRTCEIFSAHATFRKLCETRENGKSIVSICRKCMVVNWQIDGKFV